MHDWRNYLQNSANYDYMMGRLLTNTDTFSCGQSIQSHSKYSDVIRKKSLTGSEEKCAFEYSLLRGIILFSQGNMLSLKPTGAVGSHCQICTAWLQLCKPWNSKAEAKSPLSTSGIGAKEMRNLQKITSFAISIRVWLPDLWIWRQKRSLVHVYSIV